MAFISDPRVIAWSDQRARTLADSTEEFVAKLLAYQSDWIAQGITAIITSQGASNLIADGSVTVPDGRQQITGTTLINFKAAVDQMVTALNSTLVTGVGTTVKSVADTIQVNGTAR